MYTHKIKLYYSVTGADRFHQSLQQLHDSVNTETTDLIINEVPDSPVSKLNQKDSEYYTLTLNYPPNENPIEILEQINQELVKYCDWSQVGYHKCEDVSDNPAKTNCLRSEDKIHRDGDIPKYIPSLN
jgi:predicted Zn-dependent protease